jgi:glucarate dehydratase
MSFHAHHPCRPAATACCSTCRVRTGRFFTRNLVILTDTAGRTGVGEVPGGEKIRQTLEDARPLVEGQPVGDLQRICWTRCARFADRDSGGRGLQTFDLRGHPRGHRRGKRPARPAGPAPGVPVAACWAKASSASAVQMLGYLFYVGDRKQDRSALCTAASPRTGRRLVAPAPRAGPDARRRGAPGRSRPARYGFQRLQAQGRRAARAKRRWRPYARCTSAFRRPASRWIPTAAGC